MGADAPERTRLDLVVSGHTNLDHMLRVKSLPQAETTVPLRGEEALLGGTAANLAIAAAREKVHVGLISLVGDEFPTILEDRIRREGVDVSGIRRVARTSTTTCHIVEDLAGHQFTLLREGPMDTVRRPGPEAALVGASSWVHLATGNPQYQLALQKIALGRGVRVGVDPAQEIRYRWERATLSQLLAGAEILFGNQAEIQVAREILGLDSIRALLEKVPLIVATGGREGAWALSRRARERAPAAAVASPRNLVGAGDAFRAGFYSGWLRGEPLRACLVRGTGAAKRWILRPRR